MLQQTEDNGAQYRADSERTQRNVSTDRDSEDPNGLQSRGTIEPFHQSELVRRLELLNLLDVWLSSFKRCSED